MTHEDQLTQRLKSITQIMQNGKKKKHNSEILSLVVVEVKDGKTTY